MTRRLALVLSCEHASNACPPEMDLTGIDPADLDTHAAWDPGALPVATAVAQRFGAPLVAGRWTRLFCDLNRSPTSPEAIPVTAFGVAIPSNARLDEAGRARRIAEHHAPYWREVREHVDAALARADAVLHLSVHSFVEVYQGRHRAVDLGILIDPAAPLEAELARALAPALSGFLVRENEPYDGRADALTTALRGQYPPARYAGVELEINQRHLGGLPRVSAQVIAALEPLVTTARPLR